jgi:phosphomethylpyrimidine synthase
MGLMDELKRGDAIPWLEAAAFAEGVSAEQLAKSVLDGTAAVVANVSRRGRIRPVAVGAGLRTKVNANIGTSDSTSGLPSELVKLDCALRAGADAVMDLSTGGDLAAVRRAILERCDVPLGTVPIYEAGVIATREHGSVRRMTAAEMLGVVRRQAEAGVDFQTIHAAFTREQAERVATSRRLTGVVSRGGAMLANWMAANDAENPLFERFDEVLEICAEYDVTLSLGDSLRPGCLADAGDRAQMAELAILGDLVLRAREAGVQVIVEGPGHVPIADVASQMRKAKRLCHGAPLYVLGPLVTDIAPGYDHITAAIGGAVAASAGADFLCYVTPAEHLCLPDADDVTQGVVASRIAAHAGDISKGITGAREADDRMARARKALDWDAQFDLAIDPVRPREVWEQRAGTPERECSMCGALCAMRQADEARACLAHA